MTTKARLSGGAGRSSWQERRRRPRRRPTSPAHWTMTYTTREGVKMTSTLTLKVEGETGHGHHLQPAGHHRDRGGRPSRATTSPSRSCASGSATSIRIDYTGKVKGDTMTLKMKAGAKAPLDVTAKRGAAEPPKRV